MPRVTLTLVFCSAHGRAARSKSQRNIFDFADRIIIGFAVPLGNCFRGWTLKNPAPLWQKPCFHLWRFILLQSRDRGKRANKIEGYRHTMKMKLFRLGTFHMKRIYSVFSFYTTRCGDLKLSFLLELSGRYAEWAQRTRVYAIISTHIIFCGTDIQVEYI
jgi:hypothetical protein